MIERILTHRIDWKILAVAAMPVAVAFVVSTWTFSLGLLVALFLLITLSLGGTFLIALQYTMGQPWRPPTRLLPLSLGTQVHWIAPAMMILLLPLSGWYPWTSIEEAGFRGWWLERTFFLIRTALYLALWTFLAQQIGKALSPTERSRRAARRSVTRWSVGFLLFFGFTFWLACTDWILSLRHWHSTLFGFYNLGGLLLGSVAAVIILSHHVPADSQPSFLDEATLHNLGKFLFAVSNIWMYLWFCQYMLIWYANIPPEAEYYVTIFHSRWMPLLLPLILCNWLIPFMVLLPRWAKVDPNTLYQLSWMVLLGRWADISLMIFPGNVSSTVTAVALSLLLSFGGVVWLFRRSLYFLARRLELTP